MSGWRSGGTDVRSPLDTQCADELALSHSRCDVRVLTAGRPPPAGLTARRATPLPRSRRTRLRSSPGMSPMPVGPRSPRGCSRRSRRRRGPARRTPAGAAGMVTRPCLSGTSSCALAKKTRPYARAALWVTGCACSCFREAPELGRREDVETAFLPLRDHDTTRQLVAELRRKDQPALVVETRSVGAQKHRTHPLAPCVRPARMLGRGPPGPAKPSGSANAPHCTPLPPTVNRLRRRFVRVST